MNNTISNKVQELTQQEFFDLIPAEPYYSHRIEALKTVNDMKSNCRYFKVPEEMKTPDWKELGLEDNPNWHCFILTMNEDYRLFIAEN